MVLQPVRVRQPAADPHRPTISFLSAPPAIPAVIASQPAAAVQDSVGMSPPPVPAKSPELLLSPRLLSCPPELSTVVLLPLEQADSAHAYDSSDVITASKCSAAKPLASSRTSALSFSYSQLLASLEDSYSEGSCKVAVLWIRIRLSSEFWTRILLDFQKVPNPVRDPTLRK
jgi:hypothetical protein